jgi:hypothetical protein
MEEVKLVVLFKIGEGASAVLKAGQTFRRNSSVCARGLTKMELRHLRS